jgi:hypothetical protein
MKYLSQFDQMLVSMATHNDAFESAREHDVNLRGKPKSRRKVSSCLSRDAASHGERGSVAFAFPLEATTPPSNPRCAAKNLETSSVLVLPWMQSSPIDVGERKSSPCHLEGHFRSRPRQTANAFPRSKWSSNSVEESAGVSGTICTASVLVRMTLLPLRRHVILLPLQKHTQR